MSFPPPTKGRGGGRGRGSAAMKKKNGSGGGCFYDNLAQQQQHQQGTPQSSSSAASSGGKRKKHSNSPYRGQQQQQQQQQYAPTLPPGSPLTPPPKRTAGKTAAASNSASTITVLLHRVDLYDSGNAGSITPMTTCSTAADDADDDHQQQHAMEVDNNYPHHQQEAAAAAAAARAAVVSPYYFDEEQQSASKTAGNNNNNNNNHDNNNNHQMTVSTLRVQQQQHHRTQQDVDSHDFWMQMPLDKKTRCPFDQNDAKLAKYWRQRHRLFSRFDQGIQLDNEGWFSVTPEQVADHVARRLRELILASPPPSTITAAAAAAPAAGPTPASNSFVLLDAFGGCGGNAIAFAKIPEVTQVICVDVDRTKLIKAAHNAKIYQIPPHKIVFLECNVLFILEYCYRNGVYALDMAHESAEAAMAFMEAMPPPVDSEVVQGYSIGGIDLLPRGIDAVFMDPPWGGVDYEVFGKSGYDLVTNMKIEKQKANKCTTTTTAAPPPNDDEGLHHEFFDTFLSEPRSKQERMKQFNCERDEDNCVDGSQLLRLAARATRTRTVVFDVPRNTNRASVGRAALHAGYRGNCKLEEHYLNGRLKTVTVYFGSDWSFLCSKPL